jgi:hypothetical protein
LLDGIPGFIVIGVSKIGGGGGDAALHRNLGSVLDAGAA